MEIREQQSRTARLIGSDALSRLTKSCVAIFGVGGVGGYAAEALARCGIGEIHLFDNDTVSISNLNRQIIALHSTVGRYKVDAMAERISDIDPLITVKPHRMFFSHENADSVDFTSFDYVIDAIDTVSAKIELVVRCNAVGTPIISAMGAGNKISARGFKVCDIYDTSVCPLARVMRHELRKRGISSLKTVYSTDESVTPVNNVDSSNDNNRSHKIPPASISYVPAVCGLMLAEEVIKDLQIITGDCK